MPWQDSANPLGAGNEQGRYGQAIWIFAATKTTLPVVGNIVAVKSPYTPPATPGDTNQTTVTLAYAIKCPDNAGARMIGVCVGGSTLGTNPVAGGMVMVCVEGIAQVLFYKTTTATVNHSVIINTAHAGLGKDSATPVAGKTLGTILETVAVGTHTPPHKVPVYVHKT
jgi:hypothetical protein